MSRGNKRESCSWVYAVCTHTNILGIHLEVAGCSYCSDRGSNVIEKDCGDSEDVGTLCNARRLVDMRRYKTV